MIFISQPTLRMMLLLGSVFGGTAAFAQYSFVNVADTTTLSPNGALFTAFASSNLNAKGKVAFIADSANSQPRSVYLSGSEGSGPLSIVATNGGPAPGGNIYTNIIGGPFVNDNDTVAFLTNSGGDNSGTGIFTAQAGPTPTGVIARHGQAAPGFAGDLRFGITSYSVTLNSSNTGAATISVNNGVPSTSGVFKGAQGASAGALTKIAGTGEIAPGTGGGTFLSHSLSPGINDSGQVVFYSTVIGGTATAGVFLGDGVNPVSAVALTGQAAVGGGTYNGFLTAATTRINNAGRVVFGAGTGASNRLIAVGGGLPDAVMAISGAAAPGGGVFSSFDGPMINNGGTVAFWSSLTGIVGAQSGLYTTGPGGGSPFKVIREGDSLFGSIVTSLRGTSGLTTALNNNGQLSFVYALADGRKGVALATAGATAPEPGTLALMLGGATLSLLYSRRRAYFGRRSTSSRNSLASSNCR